MNWLIVVGGGKGKRMSLGFNKIFAPLNNFPLLYWTLQVFEKNRVIDNIIISASEKDIKKIKSIIRKYNIKKVKEVVKASDSRQNSTFDVLKRLKSQMGKRDLVGVHNAVNPFVSVQEIKEVFTSAGKFGAALLAHPAKDTVKISNSRGLVSVTPIRKDCWYAQTPQVATFQNLWRAFSAAESDNFVGTDDTQLLERIGVKVKIVPCSFRNFKITFPEDLMLASQILNNMNKG